MVQNKLARYLNETIAGARSVQRSAVNHGVNLSKRVRGNCFYFTRSNGRLCPLLHHTLGFVEYATFVTFVKYSPAHRWQPSAITDTFRIHSFGCENWMVAIKCCWDDKLISLWIG